MEPKFVGDAFVVFSRKFRGFRCHKSLWAKEVVHARLYGRYEVAEQVAAKLNPAADAVTVRVGLYVHTDDDPKIKAAALPTEPAAEPERAAA